MRIERSLWELIVIESPGQTILGVVADLELINHPQGDTPREPSGLTLSGGIQILNTSDRRSASLPGVPVWPTSQPGRSRPIAVSPSA